MEGKQTNFILWQKASSPLRSSDLLVYSYLAKRDRYNESKCSDKGISDATGLHRETVASAIARLKEINFAVETSDGGLGPVPQADYFFRRAGTGHFTETTAFWKTFIPSDNSQLSLNDALVYSFLLHCKQTKYNPQSWSAVYIGNSLGLDGRTVKDSLDWLTKLKLFRIENGGWIIRENLTAEQEDYFCDKLSASKGKVSLVSSDVWDDVDANAEGGYNSEMERMLAFMSDKIKPRVKEGIHDRIIKSVRAKGEIFPEKYWQAYTDHWLTQLAPASSDQLLN